MTAQALRSGVLVSCVLLSGSVLAQGIRSHILDHEDQGMMQNVLIAPRGVQTTMVHKQ